MEVPELATTVTRGVVDDTRRGDLELVLKMFIPIGTVPLANVKLQLDELFKKCFVTSHTLVRRSVMPRAEYEEQLAEWRMTVNVIDEAASGSGLKLKSRVTMLLAFLDRFCYYSSVGLHDQLFIELPGVPKIVNEVRPQHANIPVATIAIGNCPNPGLFFVRGDYISAFNGISNKFLSNRRDNRRRAEEMTQYNAAGKQTYLSFANFEHDRRILNVYFATPLQEEQPDGLLYAGYRIMLPYSAFVQIFVDLRDSKLNSIYFRLKHPPQLWEAVAKPPQYMAHNRRILNLENCREWARVLQWSADERSSGCSQEALADCQYLQVAFPKQDNERTNEPSEKLLSVVSRLMTRCSAKVHFGTVFSQLKRLPVVHDVGTVGSFRADYALKAIISRGSVVTDQLFGYVEQEEPKDPPFFDVVRWCMKECQRACEEALENLLCAIDERRSMNLLKAFHHMYSARVDAYRRLELGETVRTTDLHRSLPKNCVMVRKVMVTPLRILFMAPEVMMTNRVVRHFGEENALRCVFRDDSGMRLTVKEFLQGTNNDQQSAIIAGIVQRTLSHGVQIHDRHYYFLAWSNSQMRDHGCYMYAPPWDPLTGEISMTIDQMRQWMGDFSGSKNVPKLMSRMGQCFTQAQPTINLTPDMWIVEMDVEGGEGHPETGEAYCYSDGCGRISARLAREIALILKLHIVPSCFQVRFKGFKGVLAIDPMLDLVPRGPQVIFRKSQQKFVDADDEEGTVLEIVKHAMPSPVCLNRPMITILDWVAERQSSELHHRLCRKIHYYLEKELSNLGAMLMDEQSAAEGLTQRVSLPIDFARLRNCGFSLTNEPFMRQILVSVYRYNISNHLSKAKIFLPASMGRSMYGIVDETGLLQYGQVFIQYSPSLRKASDKPILYTGSVLITKNPCHVAGDVRMFTAVDQPALRHLFDVVVFPRHGPRPHPDEMAGSDLDGDEYSVVFDQDIAFDHNETAMVFPKSTPADFDAPPGTEDMVDFFLKYLRQDSIGRMSNAHLIMADRRGLFDDVSDEIARKCSIAVDFPKSGEPADPLAPHEQCDIVPDYIYSSVKPMYRSPRLNGQLFRKAKKVEEVLELAENTESVFENDVDQTLVPSGVDLFERDEATRHAYKRLRDEYASRMQQLLDEYGISDEAAVVSGHIVSLKRLTAMERDDYSYYHTDKIVELRYAKIFNHFRAVFFQEFGGEEDLMITESNGDRVLRTDPTMELKARRWYQLAYVDTSRGRRSLGPCRSFAWVVWDVLAVVKRKSLMMAQDNVCLDECPLAVAMNDSVERLLDRKSAEVDEFIYEIMETPGVVRDYAIAYGRTLLNALFVLYNWLNEEQLFTYTRLSMHHVALLFLQFGRGIRHGASGIADAAEMSVLLTEKPLSPSEPLGLAPIDVATTILAFLRYLGSQRFALAEYISLKLDNEVNAPLLVRSHMWMPFSQLAFRTYHHIAVSGRFDALRLTQSDVEWSEGESRDPIIVSSSLLFCENYNQEPLPMQRILDTLKEWTGVSQIHVRQLNSGRRNDVILVTSVGTVASRQRLSRLLLMPVEKLRRAVREDRIPCEVRDHSL